jgi:hypothetical protein
MADGMRGDGGREARGRSKKAGALAAVRLSEILPGARFVACDDIVARRCHDTPEACRPGDLFIARLEAGGDGHDMQETAQIQMNTFASGYASWLLWQRQGAQS